MLNLNKGQMFWRKLDKYSVQNKRGLLEDEEVDLK